MTTAQDVHLVTGAFGYSGSRIARRLLEAGHRLRTLTRSTTRAHDFGDSIEIFPLDFADSELLGRALSGVRVLYNTYWVRFARAGFSQEQAVRDTIALFSAARRAGVERIVHVSITNPSVDSPYEYFRGKARLEQALADTGVSHAILRPAVFFGGEDILINNIAWLLRRLPLFGVCGDGTYCLQPIHVDDFAELAALAGARTGDEIIDAIGPETYGFGELVAMLGRAIGRPRRIIRVPRQLGHLFAALLGVVVRDVVLTRPEIDALMDGLLATDSPAAGTTRLSEWVDRHSAELGRRYASELARRRDRSRRYADL